MDKEKLINLKDLAKSADQGTWEDDDAGNIMSVHLERNIRIAINLDPNDAAFIAAAHPKAILELIAELERLETVINGYKNANGEAQEIINELKAKAEQLEKEADWLATFCVDLCPNVPYQVNCQSCDCCPGRIDCKDSDKPESWRNAAREYISGDDNA